MCFTKPKRLWRINWEGYGISVRGKMYERESVLWRLLLPFKNPKRAVQGKMRITEADEMGATDKEKLHTSQATGKHQLSTVSELY